MRRFVFLLLFLFAVPLKAQVAGGQIGSIDSTAGKYFTSVDISQVRILPNGVTLTITNPSANTDTLIVGYTVGNADTTHTIWLAPGSTYAPPSVIWSAFWIKSTYHSGSAIKYSYWAVGGVGQ